ncbi:MAG: hypothetical protein DRH06_05035 [Deltaproteobacteria bacterium]|nr:MAG: hypothetical protein DRH07_03020 [Deltaproteobacteria bacterium]RLB76867.1 MAG: hypothetical protein DRH06_05035 [Deltaproteobacteria bacterium]
MRESQKSSIREAWILCLVLGMIMINFPFIHIFSSAQLIFGVPKLVLYFFIGWPTSIIVIWYFVRHIGKEPQDSSVVTEDKSEP